jgi:ABC-type proline/glycine betaine transport system permease subunit
MSPSGLKKLAFLSLPIVMLSAILVCLFSGTGFFSLGAHGLVPGGAFGDQIFYLWAIRRAQNVTSLKAFFEICTWSNEGCTDLRAIPHEWINFYILGKFASLAHISEGQIVSGYYAIGVVLNTIAAFAFILVVSRNAYFATAFAPLVAFQESLVPRLLGHMSLSTVWQAFAALASLWCLLRAVRDARNRRVLLYSVLTGLFIAFAMIQTFYYFAFLILLVPLIGIGFWFDTKLSSRSSFALNRDLCVRALVAACPVFVICSMALWCISYVIFGADGAKDSGVHQRSESLVIAYSARIQDFFRPAPNTFSGFLMEKMHFVFSTPDRAEVVSYLGLGLLAAAAATLIFLCASMFGKRSRTNWKQWILISEKIGSAPVFLFLGILTGYFSSEHGALFLHHALSEGLRCFSRMAPFVSLFISTSIACVWMAFRARTRAIGAVVFCLIGLVDLRIKNGVFDQIAIQRSDLSQISRIVSDMRRYCAVGNLELKPQMPNFISGSYMILYLVELSGCRIDGIGPLRTRVANPSKANFTGRLEWDASRPDGIDSVRVSNY